MEAFKVTIFVVSFLFAATAVYGQGSGNSVIASIPGASTATQIMASSVDGMSRYFAPDGPIQPAITAIGGLPMRGTEYINRGITSMSSGLNRGAQGLSRSAGNNGNVQMPGMQSIRSMMPDQVGSLGSMMRSAIQGKNGFIRGQAESGVQAGDRLRSMMQNGLQQRKKRDTSLAAPAAADLPPISMVNTISNNGLSSLSANNGAATQSQATMLNGISSQAANMMPTNAINNQASVVDPLMGESTMMHGSGGMEMMDHMQDTMMKGADQIKNQLKEHLNGHMSRMQTMSGMGDNMRNQAEGLHRTLSNGLMGTMEHLQRTGEQVSQQLQGGMQKNMGLMSGLMGSMNKSMGNMGQHMQNNAEGLMRTAHSGIQQVTSHLQQAASGPLSMLQNLSSSLTSMMQGKMNSMGGGGGGGSSGRY